MIYISTAGKFLISFFKMIGKSYLVLDLLYELHKTDAENIGQKQGAQVPECTKNTIPMLYFEKKNLKIIFLNKHYFNLQSGLYFTLTYSIKLHYFEE